MGNFLGWVREMRQKEKEERCDMRRTQHIVASWMLKWRKVTADMELEDDRLMAGRKATTSLDRVLKAKTLLCRQRSV